MMLLLMRLLQQTTSFCVTWILLLGYLAWFQGLKKYVQNWKMSICDFMTHVKLYRVDFTICIVMKKKYNQHTFSVNSKTLLNKTLMFYILFGGTTWLSKFQMLVFFQWQNVQRCLHSMMDLKNYHNFAIFYTSKIWKFGDIIGKCLIIKMCDERWFTSSFIMLWNWCNSPLE